MHITKYFPCPQQPAYQFTLRAAILFAAIFLAPTVHQKDSFASSYISLLQPSDIAVVVNTAHPDSKSLALYYMQKRFVPWRNLITVETTTRESCSRGEYETQIAIPVRNAIKKLNRDRAGIRCIVLMRGIPLKIRQGNPNQSDMIRLKNLKEEQKNLSEKLAKIRKTENGNKKRRAAKETRARIKAITERINALNMHNTRASVDSELSLVLAGSYPLAGWLANPLFSQFVDSNNLNIKSKDVIMVSRLDGPDAATVRRIIDDSIYVEEHGGLRGTAYFDARWKLPANRKGLSGYKLYDAAIYNAADIVRKSRRLRVVTESTGKLFAPGSCDNAAIYCGWYSLAKYVDAFKWVRGAVGYHIASAECSTLRKKETTVWCKKMLEKGVAATLGPVYEPYVQAFPFPDIFFASLIFNGSTLAEAYWYSIPFTSWQMVLIADPLYRPFPTMGMRLR